MKEKVYIETSVLLNLACPPCNDVVKCGLHLATDRWWEVSRPRFDCFVSKFVVEELSDSKAINSENKGFIDGLHVLDSDDCVKQLASNLTQKGLIPMEAKRDAMHIALAAFHRIDYLSTWNCKTIGNALIRDRLAKVVQEAGYKCPNICIPFSLMGVDYDDDD